MRSARALSSAAASDPHAVTALRPWLAPLHLHSQLGPVEARHFALHSWRGLLAFAESYTRCSFTRASQHSPYSARVNAEGTRATLERHGRAVAEISFPEEPRFYSLGTKDGIPYWKIARLHARVIGIVIAPAVTIASAAAYMLERHGRIVLPETLRSGWLPVHVTLALLGYALFLLSAGVSLLYLIYESRLKAKRPLPGPGEWVPSLETLDRINYRLLGWGFAMLSLAIVTGAIWADATWGHFWSWEPQESWSLITWILYAGLLESRLTVG